MSEDSNKLLENLMGMLGDNPAETIEQMLSSLSSKGTDSQTAVDAEEAKETTPQSGSGGLDPSLLLALQGLMGQSGLQEKDERSALLAAIRPFLSEERRPQIDRAIKLLQLTKLAKTAQEMNLFKELL